MLNGSSKPAGCQVQTAQLPSVSWIPIRSARNALLQLMSTPIAPTSQAQSAFQEAVWANTDGSFAGERAAALLRAAALDPDALPTGSRTCPIPTPAAPSPRRTASPVSW
jgi:hypothetical protein